ncbi:MAG: hypothetical protein HY336_00615 [Candidatus Doudnabacteria bacterium]|nr:hypothetical protein [Candidatus Doudnabacteria bacterium]
MPDGNILDRIIGSQTQSSLTNFEPIPLVQNVLSLLKERDKEILCARFGLNGQNIETLEAIGKKYNLTRERVRQIEKDSLNLIKKKKLPELSEALQLVFDTIFEHGSIISEDELIGMMLPGKNSRDERQAVKFLLCLGDQFTKQRETSEYKEAWNIVGFVFSKLDEAVTQFVGILKQTGSAMPQDQLFEKIKQTDFYKQNSTELADKVLKTYLNLAKSIQVNPFNEVGLGDWTEIKPRDVGDKAYLVLKHHGKPEHYSAITNLINESKFDDRVAYQETVHNELIKDERFVLIGRGIYALSEWGYKKGVVADVIADIIKSFGRPMTRDEIVNQVLKKRQVKRNTILVGLSNKKYFQKVDKDKFTLANDSANV